MAITRLQFMLFYSVFLMFVVMISGMAGQSILVSEGMENLPMATGEWWEVFTLPIQYFTYFLAFLTISTEFTMIFALILMPFFIGIILLVAEMIRGN